MWSCEEVEYTGVGPGKVCRHVSVLDSDSMYVFGGSPETNSEPVNLFRYEMKARKWYIENKDIRFDSLVAGHTACMYGHHIYIYAGLGSFREFFSGYRPSLYRFCVKKSSWKRISYRGVPYPIFGHTSTVYQSGWYHFGGGIDHDYDHEDQTNDIWRYDFEFHKIDKLNVQNPSIVSPREGHCAQLYKNQLYIFGGRSKTGRFNDMYSFDFVTEKWHPIVYQGVTKPSPRAACSMNLIGDSFYFFGGYNGEKELNEFYQFHIAKSTWKEILLMGTTPHPLGLHSAVLRRDASNIEIIVYGGISGASQGDHNYDDLYVLRTTTSLGHPIDDSFSDISIRCVSQSFAG